MCRWYAAPMNSGTNWRTHLRERLLVTTGSIRAGYCRERVLPGGGRRPARSINIPYEVLTGPETGRRFPGYRFDHDIAAVYQADGGFLLPERCIVNHVNRRAGGRGRGPRAGAGAWTGSRRARGWSSARRADSYRAARLVVSAGPWAAKVVAGAGSGTPSPSGRCWAGSSRKGRSSSAPTPSPCSVLYAEEGRFYGFPVYGVPGFKVGRSHHLHQTADPDQLDRDVYPKRMKPMLRSFVERYFPAAAGPALSLKTCMFTNSPDGHFIIDLHPRIPAGVAGLRLLRARLQVRQRHRRDHGRPCDVRRDQPTTSSLFRLRPFCRID